jgi:hypothetical protein
VSRADKRRRRLQEHRQAARCTAAAGAGLPEFAPTPERLRRGDVRIQPLIAAAEPGDAERDWTGERSADGPRRVLMGHVRRDLNAAVRGRLNRFRDLDGRQIAAAERLERDWDVSGLEPRMTSDPLALGVSGGQGGAVELRGTVIDARDRLQAARNALRKGGPEVLRIVEGLVMLEATAETIGSAAYAGRRDASVYVRTVLGVGLNLLADHYASRPPSGG